MFTARGERSGVFVLMPGRLPAHLTNVPRCM